MAKVIKTETQSQKIGSRYSFWVALLIGLVVGVLYWCFAALIERYVIDPLYCQSQINASVCMNDVSISGRIATILAGLAGIVAMVRFSMARPLLIALASGFVLWDLANWIDGFGWIEAVAWSALIYGLSYLSFSWINRYSKIFSVLIALLVIIACTRYVTGM